MNRERQYAVFIDPASHRCKFAKFTVEIRKRETGR
jgi:hypothetical protein